MINMSYWRTYGLRWVLVLGTAAWGFHDSGWAGMFYALILLGFGLFLLYTFLDMWHRLTGSLTRPNVTNNFIVVEEDVLKGTPVTHPDPTRPTVEDNLAIIESYKHRKEIGK